MEKQISPSSLAWQRHSIRRNTPGHSIDTKVAPSRAIKRRPMPEKYDKQLMSIISDSGLNKFPRASTTVPPPVAYKPPQRT